MHSNSREEIQEIPTGCIGAIVGLKDTKTGDTLCDMNDKFLVESIESSSEIDSKRAVAAIDRAKKRKLKQSSKHDEQRIEASLFRAMNRLKVSKR